MKGDMPMPVESDRKDELHISFNDPDKVYDILGDFDLGEEVEFTVKGKIKGFSIHDEGDYKYGHFDMEITSIDGKTMKVKKNKEELDDMTEEMMPMGKIEEED